jgi:hypothetical protein
LQLWVETALADYNQDAEILIRIIDTQEMIELNSRKSICVISPVITAVEPKPTRVKNILICSVVVFCASSKIINELPKS